MIKWREETEGPPEIRRDGRRGRGVRSADKEGEKQIGGVDGGEREEEEEEDRRKGRVEEGKEEGMEGWRREGRMQERKGGKEEGWR